MVTIYIDNKPYEVKEGNNLLHEALSKGLDVPYFCWHPALGSVGACRQCAVVQYKDANDTKGRVVMSCMTPVSEGGCYSVEHPDAKHFRENVIEWLMTNHPHDCPVCDEGGECHLQDMTQMSGHNYRRYRFKKRTFENQDLGPVINHEANRCITCYRCVRYYNDVAGDKDLAAHAAANHVYFGREADGTLESEFSGNLVEICPTGVFTDKTFKKHFNRKWDLQTAPSVCQMCSVGCNTSPGERYGGLRRIQNRYNGAINGYFICDKGRFGHAFVNSEKRLSQSSEEDAVKKAARVIAKAGRVIGVGSPRASLEANYALRTLVGAPNFYAGIRAEEHKVLDCLVDIYQKGIVKPASAEEIAQADMVVILGEDLTNTAARLALAVRESVNHQRAQRAAGKGIPSWNDAAIRNAERNPKGNVYSATCQPTKLEDIAESTFHFSPSNIAKLSFAIAHLLDKHSEDVVSLPIEVGAAAQEIVEALNKAQRPVFITGTSLFSADLIKGVSNCVQALRGKDVKANFACALSESNSLGLHLLGPQALEGEDADVAIILETDLHDRFCEGEVKAFRKQHKKWIVLESIDTRTTQEADICIPVTTFFEGAGTFVNYEGRVQRYYRVKPPKEELRDAWRVIYDLLSANAQKLYPWENLDRITHTLGIDVPLFRHFTQEVLKADFRIHGQKIPRETVSWSGRTAVYAADNVHEPKTPEDPDSPLSHSMEGYHGQAPTALTPFFWAPQWNSIQSVNKYQKEIAGHLKGGDGGILLFSTVEEEKKHFYKVPSFSKSKDNGDLHYLPLPQLFGSDLRSSFVDEIKALTKEPVAMLSTQDAERLGLKDGHSAEFKSSGAHFQLAVKVLPHFPKGFCGVSVLKGKVPTLVPFESCELSAFGGAA